MAEKGGKTSAKSAKSKIIKGTTSSGLKYQIDPAIKEDVRTLMYLTEMQDKTLEPLEQSGALFKLLKTMFGQEVETFLNTVAYLHGGTVTSEILIDELNEIFDSAKLKNS